MAKEKEPKPLNVSADFAKVKQKRAQDLNSGDSGLKRLFDYDVTSEPDVCLQGQAGSIALNLMRKTDPIVGGIITAYNNPIKSSQWSVTLVKDDVVTEPTPREAEGGFYNE